eukprot:m.29738 g.29738  ORF g.29738 m.29738 type:complete len:90 (+) comp6178_c0_seq1:870-1139(+)
MQLKKQLSHLFYKTITQIIQPSTTTKSTMYGMTLFFSQAKTDNDNTNVDNATNSERIVLPTDIFFPPAFHFKLPVLTVILFHRESTLFA